jgi:superfamily II DNA helicase RecQ
MKSSKGGSRSFVWEYFTKTEDKMHANCSKCSKTIKLCGNTTNLSNHLKKHIKDTAELNFLDVSDKPNKKWKPPVSEPEFVDLSETPSTKVIDEDGYILTHLESDEEEKIKDDPPPRIYTYIIKF